MFIYMWKKEERLRKFIEQHCMLVITYRYDAGIVPHVGLTVQDVRTSSRYKMDSQHLTQERTQDALERLVELRQLDRLMTFDPVFKSVVMFYRLPGRRGTDGC